MIFKKNLKAKNYLLFSNIVIALFITILINLTILTSNKELLILGDINSRNKLESSKIIEIFLSLIGETSILTAIFYRSSKKIFKFK